MNLPRKLRRKSLYQAIDEGWRYFWAKRKRTVGTYHSVTIKKKP